MLSITLQDSAAYEMQPCDTPDPLLILILEDDELFGNSLAQFLSSHGYQTVVAHTGLEAMPFVTRPNLAAIVCDIVLPTMPGDLFYTAVERINPQLCERFIFMSGFRGVARIETILEKTAAPVLNKPFALNDLLAAVTPLTAGFRRRLP